jgi:hypothetical protein
MEEKYKLYNIINNYVINEDGHDIKTMFIDWLSDKNNGIKPYMMIHYYILGDDKCIHLRNHTMHISIMTVDDIISKLADICESMQEKFICPTFIGLRCLDILRESNIKINYKMDDNKKIVLS